MPASYFGLVNSQYSYTAYFASAVIWLPYAKLMYSLYKEHKLRKKFPQNVILFLLTFNVVVRCIWFFLYPLYAQQVAMVVFNRVAILAQFSALSILMLMWIRALEITSLADQMARSSTRAEGGDSHSQKTGSQRGTMTSSERWRSVKHSHNEALLRLEAEKKQQIYIRLCLGVNVIVWVLVLGSLAKNSDQWYDINILAISSLCWVEACITLVIGLRTALALQRELAPTTITNADLNVNQYRVETGLKGWARCMCSCVSPFYRLFFSRDDSQYGLQIQRDVVKTIVGVSVIVFIFFLLRSLAFLNRPVLEDEFHETQTSTEIGSAMYPLFFYQFPEFFPNLAIALGIAPPKSLIRSLYRWIVCAKGVDGRPHPLTQCLGRHCPWWCPCAPIGVEYTEEEKQATDYTQSMGGASLGASVSHNHSHSVGGSKHTSSRLASADRGLSLAARDRETTSDNFFEPRHQSRTASTTAKRPSRPLLSSSAETSNFRTDARPSLRQLSTDPIGTGNPLHRIDETDASSVSASSVEREKERERATKAAEHGLEEGLAVPIEPSASMHSLRESDAPSDAHGERWTGTGSESANAAQLAGSSNSESSMRASHSKVHSFSISRPIAIPDTSSGVQGSGGSSSLARSLGLARESRKAQRERDRESEWADEDEIAESPATAVTGATAGTGGGLSDRDRERDRERESQRRANGRERDSNRNVMARAYSSEQREDGDADSEYYGLGDIEGRPGGLSDSDGELDQSAQYAELLYNIQSLSSHHTSGVRSVDTSSYKLRELLEHAAGKTVSPSGVSPSSSTPPGQVQHTQSVDGGGGFRWNKRFW